MNIVVRTADEQFQFDATAVRTDEHNNLEVMGGLKGEKPLSLFNRDTWESALYGVELDDGTD